MADLLDIAPSTAVEIVKIGGVRQKVYGLHGDAIASIVSRFPELASLLGGGGIGNLGPKLIAQFGISIGPIIAAGCGRLGEEKAEQNASKLLVEDQLRLLKAILGLTFPNGFAAFVEVIMALLPEAAAGQKPVKMRLKKSPSRSQSSSAKDSHPIMQ